MIKDIWEKYKKIELIDSNTYSNFYKAKSKLTNEKVGIKEIIKSKINNDQNIVEKFEIMKNLKTKNSVKVIEIIETESSYYMILELCFLSLEEYLKKRNISLSIDEIGKILLELNDYFKEMNDKNIIHGNLKFSNILLSLNKSKIDKIDFKISDFGLNKIIKENKINSFKNSLIMAPEVLKGDEKSICDKSDIWSLGIIIYYLLFNEYPYNDINEIESKKKFKQFGDKYIDNLLKKMLVLDVNKRISWTRYFKHPFFKNNFNTINLPSFNIKCSKHLKELIAYCPKCKLNVCEDCVNNHPSFTHGIKFFTEIGISKNEITEIEKSIKEIENNINSYYRIKKFFNDIKSIKENISIYQDDENNNYIHYSIECLNIIKEYMKSNIEEISLPNIFKWELR